MKRQAMAALAALGTLVVESAALAHVSIISGPGIADASQEITFGVGHGCEGSDTLSVRVEIPEEVVTVRALNSDLGPAEVTFDDAGLVRAVSWEKAESSLLETDSNYYKVTVRLKVPNQPFTTLYFPARQTCRTAEGEDIVVDWISTEPSPAEGAEVEPAPTLTILPKRYSGWNKFTVTAPLTDLALFFADAQIVWKDEAAYSSNPFTSELIGETEGVSRLESLEANDEVWVKY